jgi:hypothetical protein
MSKIAKAAADKIVALLERPHPFKESTRLLPEIDAEEMAKRLEPARKGQERGAEGQPPLGFKGLDPVETEIRDTYQALVTESGLKVTAQVATYNERLANFDLTKSLDEIKDACRAAESDFKADIKNAKDSLRNFRKRVVSRLQDEEYFKQEHNIIRAPHYPTTSGKMLHWGVIVFLFLVETIGNAVFLSKGNEGGIFGAYTEALYISFLNVGVAVLLGLFVTRFIFHKSFLAKLPAMIALLLGLVFGTFLNLMVAHYREYSGEGMLAGAGGEAAIAQLFANPFGLHSFLGWILFLMGFLFFIIAVIDAHTLDDSYPGYGRVARAAEDASFDYADEKEHLTNQLTDIRLDTEEDIQAKRDELGQIQGNITSIKAARDALVAEYDRWAAHVSSQAHHLITLYREANRSARSKAPTSFNNAVALDVQKIEAGGDIGSSLDQIQQNVIEGRALLDASISNFYEEFDQAIASFDTIDSIMSLEELNKAEKSK